MVEERCAVRGTFQCCLCYREREDLRRRVDASTPLNHQLDNENVAAPGASGRADCVLLRTDGPDARFSNCSATFVAAREL
jgi:hypothetical protein